MNILSQTDNEMHLKDKGAASYLVGSIFLCVAAVFTFAPVPWPLSMKLLLVIPFWCAGLGLILFVPTIIVDIHKNEGQIRLRKKRLFITLQGDDQTYQLSDVAKVIYRESWRQDQSRSSQSNGVHLFQQRSLYQQIFFGLNNGEKVSMSLNKRPASIGIGPFSFMLHRDRERNHAEQVAAFLNIPLEIE